MPIYQYQCKECGNIFEEVLSVENLKKPFSEPCPSCKVVGKVETYFSADSISRPCFSFLGSSIQNKIKNTVISERLKEIKKNFGSKQCKGIE